MTREKTTTDLSSGLSTLDRISEVLNLFDEQKGEWTLREIGERLQLPKSTTHRLLSAMKARGILNTTTSGSAYQLGYQLIRWGDLAKTSIRLREIALPVMYDLVEKTGETAVLSVRDGMSCVWIEQVESKQPVRWVKQVGVRLMLHAGSSSKVLWAFLSEPEIEEILNHIELKPLQSRTITDKNTMRQDIHAIRQRGYAVSYEESNPDTMGIAGPVYDYTGRLAAGLGIIAPISRVSEEKVPALAGSVLESCAELSQKLGGNMNLKLTKENYG